MKLSSMRKVEQSKLNNYMYFKTKKHCYNSDELKILGCQNFLGSLGRNFVLFVKKIFNIYACIYVSEDVHVNS